MFYVGDNQAGNYPRGYLKAIQNALSQRLREALAPPPPVINNQGWLKGLSLSQLHSILKISRPHATSITPHLRHTTSFPKLDLAPALYLLPIKPSRTRCRTLLHRSYATLASSDISSARPPTS